MFKKKYIIVLALLMSLVQSDYVSCAEGIGFDPGIESSEEPSSTEEELPVTTEEELPASTEISITEEFNPIDEIHTDDEPEETTEDSNEDGNDDTTEELLDDGDDGKSQKKGPNVILIAIIIGVVVVLTAIVLGVRTVKKAEQSMATDEIPDNGSGIMIFAEECTGKFKSKKMPLPLMGQLTIGSDSGADIVFENSDVEPIHARIELKNNELYLIDMSMSGTYIEGMRIQEQNRLQSGDLVSVGSNEFKIKF